MKTITCKFLPNTETLPRRIKVSCEDNHAVNSVPYDMDVDEAYIYLAQEMKLNLGLKGEMVGGHVAGGMVFVFRDDKARLN